MPRKKPIEAPPPSVPVEIKVACAYCLKRLQREDGGFVCSEDGEVVGAADYCKPVEEGGNFVFDSAGGQNSLVEGKATIEEGREALEEAADERAAARGEDSDHTTIKMKVDGHPEIDVTDAFDRLSRSDHFNVYLVKGVREAQDVIMREIYKYLNGGGTGEPSLTMTFKFQDGRLKGEVKGSLPHDIKIPLERSTYIREAGEIRLWAETQEKLFGR